MSFTCKAPCLLALDPPKSASPSLVHWMSQTLRALGAADLWKLNVIDVASTSFYFAYEEAERVRGGG